MIVCNEDKRPTKGKSKVGTANNKVIMNKNKNRKSRKKRKQRSTREKYREKMRQNTNKILNEIREKYNKLPKKEKTHKKEEDERPWGDILTTSTNWPNQNEEKRFRVMGQNVNGISY